MGERSHVIPTDSMLTPIKRVDSRYGNIYYLYRCSCGVEKIIRKSLVVNGEAKSCGHYKKQVLERVNRKGLNRNKGNKSRTGHTPHNKGKIRIHVIPNDPSSKTKFVFEWELHDAFYGIKDLVF